MIEPNEFEKQFCEWAEAVKPSSRQQMVLGQLATDEKTNAITAVPELLGILDVAGCIITADAMSC